MYASHFRDEVEDARAGYGWDASLPGFDWPTLIANKNSEIERLNGIYGNLLENAGVSLLPGRAALLRAPLVRHINLEDWLLQESLTAPIGEEHEPAG